VTLAIAVAVFPVIFLAELPDKTMFASLLLATRGRPVSVWAGAALAFVVHVALAVTIGGVLFALLPHRAVEAIVALLFLGGGVFALRDSVAAESSKGERATQVTGARRTLGTAFVVIFLAEWGDLTQIVTATLAAQYHDPLAVGLGAVSALWAVAALAVSAGQLLERLPMSLVRRLTGIVLIVLAVLVGIEAATGLSGPL
jgi:Ca2+/H+ antiporter, TMEM165/GDT1 family